MSFSFIFVAVGAGVVGASEIGRGVGAIARVVCTSVVSASVIARAVAAGVGHW